MPHHRWYSAERLTKLTGRKQTKGRWINLENLPPPGPSVAPAVFRDVDPYRSIVTQEVIGGRRQHRDHLKRHDLVELGNERLPPRKPIEPKPGEIVDTIKRVIAQGPSDKERKALERAKKAIPA